MIGDLIKFRRKNEEEENDLSFILTGCSHGQCKTGKTFAYIYIGIASYTLDELFESYEWYDDNAKEFKPFGVEE